MGHIWNIIHTVIRCGWKDKNSGKFRAKFPSCRNNFNLFPQPGVSRPRILLPLSDRLVSRTQCCIHVIKKKLFRSFDHSVKWRVPWKLLYTTLFRNRCQCFELCCAWSCTYLRMMSCLTSRHSHYWSLEAAFIRCFEKVWTISKIASGAETHLLPGEYIYLYHPSPSTYLPEWL